MIVIIVSIEEVVCGNVEVRFHAPPTLATPLEVKVSEHIKSKFSEILASLPNNPVIVSHESPSHISNVGEG